MRLRMAVSSHMPLTKGKNMQSMIHSGRENPTRALFDGYLMEGGRAFFAIQHNTLIL